MCVAEKRKYIQIPLRKYALEAKKRHDAYLEIRDGYLLIFRGYTLDDSVINSAWSAMIDKVPEALEAAVMVAIERKVTDGLYGLLEDGEVVEMLNKKDDFDVEELRLALISALKCSDDENGILCGFGNFLELRNKLGLEGKTSIVYESLGNYVCSTPSFDGGESIETRRKLRLACYSHVL